MHLRARLLLFTIAISQTATVSARAQDVASARGFVESLYKLYPNNGTGVPYSGPDAPLYYHSSLLALIDADVKAAGPMNVGVLDGDPVCSCQDWEGIWNLKIQIQPIAEDRALADISFALTEPKDGEKPDARHVKMTLVPENGQWRIWNVVDDPDSKSPFDLRQSLTNEIRTLSQKPRS